MIRIYVTALLILCSIFTAKAQRQTPSDSTDSRAPKLVLDLPLLDLPYLSYGAQARANYKAHSLASQETKRSFGDYATAMIEAPSMSQVISYSSSFYNTMNYGIARLWGKIVPPSERLKSRFLHALGSEFNAAVAFVLTSKVPFAGGWAHEEFHRNTWSPMGVGSYNLIWEFDLAPDALTYVGAIFDQDLADFKREDPAGFVRMGAAGIEAHYLLSQRIQIQDFRHQTNLPNLALYWADFFAAYDYVNRAHKIETLDEHDELYLDEKDQLKRDFTGNDFTAWVYDLFRADEDYADRGIHPTGIGIDRYRDYNDLSHGMRSYVKKIANRQLFNIVSPFMFRIRAIKLSSSVKVNMAMRHFLTSFGDDTQLDFLLSNNNNVSSFTIHKYSNHDKDWFMGIEYKKWLDFYTFNSTKKVTGSFRAMAWQQPSEQDFFTKESDLGGLLSASFFYNTSKAIQPYIELEAKTNGWVAGVPYLSEKMSFRAGLRSVF